jgi:hypothetical protein
MRTLRSVSLREASAKRQCITVNCNIYNRRHNLKMANCKTSEDNASSEEWSKVFGEDDTAIGCDGGYRK